jgi:alpha-D-ribose 1-methylphosphonate 5-triphosphate synthase subunit PhnG
MSVDRTARCETLAQSAPEPLLDLAEQVLADSPVTLVIPPRVGMLMLRVREPVVGAIFNAGEVLVTEAQVALGAANGYAVRLGRDPEAALAAAVLDAAVEAGHPLAPTIIDALHAWAADEQARQLAAWREVAPTRVSFEEMGQ